MRHRLVTVAALGTAQTLAWASSFYLPAVLSVPMARDVGLAPPWIFAALSMGLAVSALLGPSLGRLIDRRGGRLVLCAPNVAFAIGLGLLALAIGPISIFGAWLVLGIAMAGGLYEAAFSSLTYVYGRDSRSAITGITLVAGFASTVGWPVSAYLEHRVGWRGVCMVWATLHLALGLPLNAWAMNRENLVSGVNLKEGAPQSVVPSSDRGLFLLSFIFSAWGMVSIGIATNLPGLFKVFGTATAAAISAASLLGPAQVIARLLEFSARNRISSLKSARIASVLHPLASLSIALGGAKLVPVFAVLHGAGNGMLTICRGTLPLALYGSDGYGARLGRISAPARIGQALAPFLFGLMIEKIGRITLAISSALSIAALLALSRIQLPSETGVQSSP